MFAQVQPKRPTLCQPWIRLNILLPPSIQEIFNLSSRFIITRQSTDIDPCVSHDTDPRVVRNTCNRTKKEGKGGGGGRGILWTIFFPRDTLHRFISSKRETSGETVQFEFDVGVQDSYGLASDL